MGCSRKTSLSREQTPEWYLSKVLMKGGSKPCGMCGERVPFQKEPPASAEAKARGKEAPGAAAQEAYQEGRWEQLLETRLWQGFQILFSTPQVGKGKTPLGFMVIVIQ